MRLYKGFFFFKAELYITGFKGAQRKSVIEGLKKTVFIGLHICMHVVIATFDRLVATWKLHNLFTHKMSRDHLETFFGCIKEKGVITTPVAHQTIVGDLF